MKPEPMKRRLEDAYNDSYESTKNAVRSAVEWLIRREEDYTGCKPKWSRFIKHVMEAFEDVMG